MSRYVEQLVAHVPAEAVHWTVLTNRPDALPELPAHARLIRSFPIRPTLMWQLLVASRRIDLDRADLAHFPTGRAPRPCRVPFVLTVHDLTPIEHPEWYPRRERLLVARWLGAAIGRADAVIAVSAATADAIARRFPHQAERIRVVYEAAAPIFHRPVDEERIRAVRASFGLGPRFWLHVGSLTARKNLPRLLEAFARVAPTLPGEPIELVLAGGSGGSGGDAAQMDSRVRALGLTGGVRRLGRVSDTDLRALYAAAELMVAPSLHEGFGLTVIEAMACGAPVMASHAGSLAEVAGDAAFVVNPSSVDSIATGLARLARDADLRERLAMRGRAQAARFDWARAAAETVAVYRSMLRG
jgi:glycosyltransferase involved in cell wall biosynthesis